MGASQSSKSHGTAGGGDFVSSTPHAPVVAGSSSASPDNGQATTHVSDTPAAGFDGAVRDIADALRTPPEPGVGSLGGRILFGSQTGTARRLAHKLCNSLKTRHGLDLETTDMQYFDPEDLVNTPVVLIVLATYEDASGAVPPESAKWFVQWLHESATDERFGALFLKDTKFAVFGCGNREYGADRFNSAARALDQDMARLGGERVLRRADGDESNGRMETQFHDWADRLAERLVPGGDKKQKEKAKGRVTVKSKIASAATVGQDTAETPAAVEYDTEEEEGSGGDDDDEETQAEPEAGSEDDLDMEDIGAGGVVGEKKEMVTDQLRANLTKQGYKIIGSHSGVKLCRWTKAQLRGRGGCYKHSFYGIESHRCMETTPSLACANKCVLFPKSGDTGCLPVGEPIAT